MASSKGQRLLSVFKALEAHPLIGISNKEIADGLDLNPSYVTRELEDLIEAGLVVKLDNGNFAYSVKTLQIAERFRRQTEYLKGKLEETDQRVTPNPSLSSLGWAANAVWQNTCCPCSPNIRVTSNCSQAERHSFSFAPNLPK